MYQVLFLVREGVSFRVLLSFGFGDVVDQHRTTLPEFPSLRRYADNLGIDAPTEYAAAKRFCGFDTPGLTKKTRKRKKINCTGLNRVLSCYSDTNTYIFGCCSATPAEEKKKKKAERVSLGEK